MGLVNEWRESSTNSNYQTTRISEPCPGNESCFLLPPKSALIWLKSENEPGNVIDRNNNQKASRCFTPRKAPDEETTRTISSFTSRPLPPTRAAKLSLTTPSNRA